MQKKTGCPVQPGLTLMPGIKILNENSYDFPPVNQAMDEPNGLIAVGGDLSPERLKYAYQAGIFPWFEEGQPILWWSPDPRCVLYPDELHVSKSLGKTLRKQPYKITLDKCFDQLVSYCSRSRKNSQGTWITQDIKLAYSHLHQLGIAHSVEAWSGEELVGGLYGIAMGSVFFGESMFSKKTDASKVALYHLIQKLKALSFTLIDCQVYNPHLESLGAKSIPRPVFVEHLNLQIKDRSKSNWK